MHVTKTQSYCEGIFLLKQCRIKSLLFEKLEVKMTFLDQLNGECDKRAKNLIVSTIGEETIQFPLKLSSYYVANNRN